MLRKNLCGEWKMRRRGEPEWSRADVPGSVYSNLLGQGRMEDPYVGENQYEAFDISREDWSFEREFETDAGFLSRERVWLRFEGLDTLAEVFLNGEPLGKADNMHRVWEFDGKPWLRAGKNTLRVDFSSPVRYVEEKQKERSLWGVETTTPGYPYLRKAHYMFGWDWGPQLPDMGIWRPVYLEAADGARLDGVSVTQEHEAGRVRLTVRVDAEVFRETSLCAAVRLAGPEGQCLGGVDIPLDGKSGEGVLELENPRLWWPNGYGEQPLYRLETILREGDTELDRREQRIGLRTIRVSREKDQWGEEFCFVVNGVKIFAMGADYIPEEQITARCSREKTARLLEDCIQANFNCMRVWGGGYYPEDWFFDLCDEKGILIWQDFMFACAVYRLTGEFRENITQELIDNIKRIRHHACLALWCGNNEIETAWENWGIPQEDDLRADYLEQFERLFPEICREYDPNTFYWPSSPSCGGNFDDPADCSRGDIHYWDVWHGMKPLTEFRRFYFRFCSEYGFESLPSLKTVKSFAAEEELDLFSPVLEAHQKCADGNKKLLYYLSQMVSYPTSFEELIYATQLLQADAIRSNVEHMRRNRGRCMGSTYWQVNDSNPVISWSSIDSAGRWKALHYYARRFYAPVLLSANEENPAAVVLNVSNERFIPVMGTLRWALRDNAARILAEGSIPVNTAPLSAEDCLTLDLSAFLSSREERRSRYLEYSLEEADRILSRGSSLFVPPKHFRFLDPEIRVETAEEGDNFLLTLTASAYAKSVCLDLREDDCRFSDNWFDIHGGETVEIRVEKATLPRPLSREEFAGQLTVRSNRPQRR